MTIIYQAQLRFADVTEDDSVYPRQARDYRWAALLAEKYRAGEDIPPPVVWLRDNQVFVLVDGWHRLKAAELAGVEPIACEVRFYRDAADAFRDAVRLNARHGKPLSYGDYVRISLLGQQHGLDDMEIRTLAGIQERSIQRWRVRRVALDNQGGELVLRPEAVIQGLGGQQLATPLVAANHRLRGERLAELAAQLTAALEAGIILKPDQRLNAALYRLYEALRDYLAGQGFKV